MKKPLLQDEVVVKIGDANHHSNCDRSISILPQGQLNGAEHKAIAFREGGWSNMTVVTTLSQKHFPAEQQDWIPYLYNNPCTLTP